MIFLKFFPRWRAPPVRRSGTICRTGAWLLTIELLVVENDKRENDVIINFAEQKLVNDAVEEKQGLKQNKYEACLALGKAMADRLKKDRN